MQWIVFAREIISNYQDVGDLQIVVYTQKKKELIISI